MNREDFLREQRIFRLRDEKDIAAQWYAHRKTPRRWSILRQAYALQLPLILAAREKSDKNRVSPNFLDWDFTPIEFNAWRDIRWLCLPLFPQFPVGNCFIDFADPYLKIGVELDGRDYHSVEKDEPRDAKLWEQGWRIFRIPGRESLPAPIDPLNDRDAIAPGEPDVLYRVFSEWGDRWSSGFFWALSVVYYGREVDDESLEAAAYRILNRHRLVDFPLEVER